MKWLKTICAAIVVLLMLTGISVKLSSQNYSLCNLPNTSSRPGEQLKYKVFYTLAGVYVPAGEALFSNKLETFNKRPVYHVTGFGQTYKSYDWFYKVYDTYESFIDTATMLPLKFIRNVKEGKNVIYNHVLFDHKQKKASSGKRTFDTPECVQDVLSTIYYARNIDFSKYKAGDKVYYSMFLDDEVYPLYIRYLGKEKLRTRFGTYNTIKFKPKLIPGTLFKEGEEMLVYVTDDQYKIPVYIETPILVGKIKVYYTDH